MGAVIDRLEIQIEAHAGKANKQLDMLNSKLLKVSGSLSGINTKALGNIGASFSKSVAGLGMISTGLSTFTTKSDKATKSTKSLAAAFGMFYANCFLAIRGIKALGSATKSSMDYLETLNYFEVVVNKIGKDTAGSWGENGTKSAQAYVEAFRNEMTDLTEKMTGYTINKDGSLTTAIDSAGKMIKNLSLDVEQTLNYQTMYAQIADSMGIGAKSAVNMSKALTMLGADMSSLRNQDISKVMNNFRSGLVGQSRALYQYGIDITNATLQTYAFKYGLSEAVSEMTQGTKAQLRVLAILDQSRVAWGDMSRTINTAANQLRVLQQNFHNLARSIGNILLPIIAKALPYINGLVLVLQRFFNMLGIKIHGDGFLGDLTTSVGGLDDVEDGLGDVEDEIKDVDKAATKLRSNLQRFDDLNVINTQSQVPELDFDDIKDPELGILDMEIEKALKEYEDAWNKMLENMQNKAQEIANKIEGFFKNIWDYAQPSVQAFKKLWDEGLSKLADFTWGTLSDFYNSFLVPLGKFMIHDNNGLVRFFNITNDLLNEIDWNRLRGALGNLYIELERLAEIAWGGLMDFYELFLKPIAVWTMSEALPRFVDMITKFIQDINWQEITAALRNLWNALAPFAKSVGEGFVSFYEDLFVIGADFINKYVPDGINGLAEAIRKIKPETAEKIGRALGLIVLALPGFLILSKVVGFVLGFGIAIAGLGAAFKGLAFLFSPIIATIKGIGSIAASVLGGSGSLVGAANGLVALLSGPVGVICALVAAVALAFVDLYINSETFRTFINDVLLGAFDKLKEAFIKVKDAIVPLFKSLYDFYNNSGIRSVVELLFTLCIAINEFAISSSISFLVGAIEILAGAFRSIVEIVHGVIEVLKGLFTFDFAKVIDGFKRTGSSIGNDLVGGFIKGMWTAGEGLWHAIQKLCKRIIDAFCAILGIHSPSTVFAEIGRFVVEGLLIGIQNVWESFMNFVSELPGKIVDKFTSLKEKFKEKGRGMIEGLREGWENLWGGFSGFLNSSRDNIANAFGNLYDSFKEKGRGMISGLKDGWENLWGDFSGFLRDIPRKIADSLGDLWGIGRDFIGSLADGISSVRIKMPHIVKNGSNNIFGIDIPKFSLEWRANGGFVDTGQMFMARESGPELVGTIGNKTAVANNDQITTALEHAIARGMGNSGGEINEEAMYRAFCRALNDSEFQAVLDSDQMYDGFRKKSIQHAKQTGNLVYI